MKVFLRAICALAVISAAGPAAAAEDDLPPGISELPAGMEIIKAGTANIIAPEGSRVYEENTVMIVEPIEQYAARRFLDIEARMERMESRIGSIEERLDELIDAVETLN